jgi:ATP-binding cassette, subfamily B, bacterial CvaB/MchF/RaxB
LSVAPGQFVTIMGPSGCGKTTLVKIMLGLLEPTSGEILVDGRPLRQTGTRAYREQIGAVMQEDQLLSGSIADNICFFEPTFDLQGMIECARVAGIHDDVMAMPMSYNSLIGDMGCALSSGQKQRILLARALYRRPKILFLDEGTAHLDTEKEKEINANLRHLKMTRVSIAHRPEITHGADMILHLSAGAGPLQVAATSSSAVAPGHDANLTGLGDEGTKSAEGAQGHDHNSDSDVPRKRGYSLHVRERDYSNGGEDDDSKHSHDANNGSEPDKDGCQPLADHRGSKRPDDDGKRDNDRNAGETLAKIDFSSW